MNTSITFTELGLSAPLLRALAAKNYTTPSPIQAQAIPHLLDGRDMMGCAQTGTGKTAAFALPILQRLAAAPQAKRPHAPRALILTPTRELASQIGENFAAYGQHLNLQHAVIYGGVGQHPQVRALKLGVEILVATPGRLLDLISQRYVDLKHIEVVVLDEADRMLDMGFAPDVKRIMSYLPKRRQSLLFSATMPESIRQLATGLLQDPVFVEVTPASTTAERIDHRICHVDRGNKEKLLLHVLESDADGRVLVFSRTKHGANRIAKNLGRSGVKAEAIHGNKSQGARERALSLFRSGKARVLVATDIAARGIDVKDISMVVNFDVPNEPESYVHRIGRTARAGAAGAALSFCDNTERSYLRDIEKLIRHPIPVEDQHPYALPTPTHSGARQDHGQAGRRGRSRPQGHARAPRRRSPQARSYRK